MTLTAANKWTYTWTNLAEKANKKDIVYSVKKVTKVDDYTTTEGKVENGNVTITNTHVPVIPEKNSQIPQQLMIQQLRQVILINNQRRNKKRNHSFHQQEIAAV